MPERPRFSRIFSGVGSFFILILVHAEALTAKEFTGFSARILVE